MDLCSTLSPNFFFEITEQIALNLIEKAKYTFL